MEALGEPRGRLGRAGGGPGGVLGGPGAVLEAYKRRLGGSLGRLGAVWGDLVAMLEPSGSQKAPKMESKRVPNPALEAIPSENGKTLFFLTTVHRISMIFHVSGLRFGTKNKFKMGSESHHRCWGRQKGSWHAS